MFCGAFPLSAEPALARNLDARLRVNAQQRVAIQQALAGYLRDYEALYQVGAIKDYPLFPAGRLKRGRAKVVANPKPLGRDGALKMFHELEAIANVTQVDGRGWYGVKRIAADVAEDVETDERLLNAVSGHHDSKTRHGYQQRERPEVLAGAARVRMDVRANTGANNVALAFLNPDKSVP